MNEQTKQDILAWAQTQVESWPIHEEDWWGAYNDEWDINIWDDTALGDGSNTASDSTGICVTAYRIYTDRDGDLQTDLSDYIMVGYCERPDTWPGIEEPDEGDGMTVEATNAIARVTAQYGDNPSDETLTDALADLLVYLIANDRWELVESARAHAWAEIEGDGFTT